MDTLQTNLVTCCLSGLGRALIDEIVSCGDVRLFNAGDYIIRQGQPVKYLPIVLEGMVKVFSQEEDVQFLLYYIHPGTTCIFSFAHLFGEKGSAFSGVADEKCLLLLIPMSKAREWTVKYPVFNSMILNEYQKHYNDLLETTKQIICYNLEDRILHYLQKKSSIIKSATVAVSHGEIATDLATSREVISRIIKKMEKEKKVVQLGRKIKLMN